MARKTGNFPLNQMLFLAHISGKVQVPKLLKVSSCAVFHALSRGIKTYTLLPGAEKVQCDLLFKPAITGAPMMTGIC